MSKGKSPQLFFILSALTLAGGTGATIFQYQGLNEKWDNLAELKKDTRDPKDIKAELDETSAKVASARAEIEHLEKSVPAFAYVPTMLKELEQCGKENGIEVLGVRPIPKADPTPNNANNKGTARKKDPYQELAIEVKGRGEFKAVQAFVAGLEKFPKIVGARQISLQPKNDNENRGLRKLDATFELRAYLFPPDAGMKVTRPTLTKPPVGGGSEAGNAAPGAQQPNPAHAGNKPADPSATTVATNGAALHSAAKASMAVSAKPAPKIAPKKTYKKSKRYWKRRSRR